MPDYRSQLEEQIARQITDFFSRRQIGAKYGLLYEPILSEFNPEIKTRFRPDFLIMKGPYAFMIIEVIGSQRLTDDRLHNRIPEYLHFLDLLQGDFFILTDGERLHVLNALGMDEIRPFDFIFSLFEQELNQQDISRLVRQVVRTISGIFQPVDPINEQVLILPRMTALLSESLAEAAIAYDPDGRFFHFAEGPENGMDGFEHQFFQLLLDDVPDQQVCRYTTLSSLFHSLTGKSYRMASHLAMNDRGEVDYVDKYIDDAYTAFAFGPATGTGGFRLKFSSKSALMLYSALCCLFTVVSIISSA